MDAQRTQRNPSVTGSVEAQRHGALDETAGPAGQIDG
jgi:hypothetical protein